MAAITASREKQNAERRQDEFGLQPADHQECGATIRMLTARARQNDCCEGAFLFIQLALEAIMLFPCIKGILTEPTRRLTC